MAEEVTTAVFTAIHVQNTVPYKNTDNDLTRKHLKHEMIRLLYK